MRYIYKCLECLKERAVDKPMSESSKKEFCKHCDNADEMEKVYSFSVKTADGFKCGAKL